MAKVYSLQVRPLRSSELAFHIPGILFRRSDTAYLGKSVNVPMVNIDGTSFDLRVGILKLLSNTDTTTGKILSDSAEIDTRLADGSLFEIYNETAKASLDQMILQRQNAFLERYKHNSKRLEAINQLFPSGENALDSRTPGSKLWHIDNVRTASQDRHDDLNTAYSSAQEDKIDRNKVVRKQLTETDNTNNYSDKNIVKATTTINPVTLVTPPHTTEVQDKDGNIKEKLVVRENVKSEQRKADLAPIGNDFKNQVITTTYPEGQGTKLDQSSYNHYSEFLHPTLTNSIRNSRAQVELMQQELADLLYSFRVDDLTNIWNNELGGLDQEVRKYQIALIRTFLLPPFSGVITAVYKDVGESVEAGEPILRIEDDEDLLFVGLINHRGSLKIGDKATIQTNDLFETGKSFENPIEVKVVSIRGHNSDNDVWDVILQGKNPLDETGKRILPLNYHFDKDNVIIEFLSS